MKKLKIMTAICLAAILAAGAVRFSSLAADTDKFAIFVDSDKEALNPGDTVNISVILAPKAHISAFTLDLLYDAKCFTYQNDAAAGPALSEGLFDINAQEEGKIVFSFMTLGSLFNESDKTVLMTASFKALKPDGVFAVLPETIAADDDNGTDVTEHCAVKEKTIGSGHDGISKSSETEKTDASGKTIKLGRPSKQEGPSKAADAAEAGHNSGIMVWILIAVFIVIVGGAACVIVLKKKRAK